jgi:hypothetical protein
MPRVIIKSESGGWSAEVTVDVRWGAAPEVARRLKALGCTGKILPGGVVEVDVDRSKVGGEAP